MTKRKGGREGQGEEDYLFLWETLSRSLGESTNNWPPLFIPLLSGYVGLRMRPNSLFEATCLLYIKRW